MIKQGLPLKHSWHVIEGRFMGRCVRREAINVEMLCASNRFNLTGVARLMSKLRRQRSTRGPYACPGQNIPVLLNN